MSDSKDNKKNTTFVEQSKEIHDAILKKQKTKVTDGHKFCCKKGKTVLGFNEKGNPRIFNYNDIIDTSKIKISQYDLERLLASVEVGFLEKI